MSDDETISLIEQCRRSLLGPPNRQLAAVYVTAELLRRLFVGTGTDVDDLDPPVTLYAVPLVVNDELATVAGGSWTPAWRFGP